MKDRWQKYGGTDIKTRITLEIDKKIKLSYLKVRIVIAI